MKAKNIMSFETWMVMVNAYLENYFNMSSEDLPDICYHDMYDMGNLPSTVAKSAIRNAECMDIF